MMGQNSRVDRALTSVARRVAAAGKPVPAVRMLASVRQAALREVLAEYRAPATVLGERVAAGDGSARSELSTLAEEALETMRANVLQRASEAGLWTRMVAIADQRWGDCTTQEYLDDESVDPAMRLGIMETLDWWNHIVEAYGCFLDAVLEIAPAGPVRILDLAAGHGGFVLAAARLAKQRGLDLRFTASDLKREYLDMGAAVAAREGLNVDFVVQDALDLSNIEPGTFDLVMCTQSLHHFPPGLVAVMFEAAARAATHGVVFIDPCRSVLTGATCAGIGGMRRRDPHFAHDAWISMRRSFVPEELELLARIGPWGDSVEARFLAPGYCLLRQR